LDKFSIWHNLFPVGQGAMSQVYSAYDPQGNKVAIKFLHQNFINNSEVKSRFIREANILKSLQIGGIANILDFDFEIDQPFIVTEFIEGLTLDQVIQADGPYDLDQAIEIFTRLASTISVLHDNLVYHRDIKPANIIISKSGPVLIDFSISNFDGATNLTQIGSVVGTPEYLAPEAYLGDNTSPSVDWWGFSATLCYALTSKVPFGTGQTILANIQAKNIDLSGLGLGAKQILTEALEPQIANRSGAWETLEALASLDKKHRISDNKAIIHHILVVFMLVISGLLLFYIFQ
jgi:serine/threonine protein kinase